MSAESMIGLTSKLRIASLTMQSSSSCSALRRAKSEVAIASAVFCVSDIFRFLDVLDFYKMILRGEWRGGTGPIRLHIADRDEILLKEQLQVEMKIDHSKQLPIIVSSTTGKTSGVDAPTVKMRARVNIVKNLRVPEIVSATISFPTVVVVPNFKKIRFSVDCNVLCDSDVLKITNY